MKEGPSTPQQGGMGGQGFENGPVTIDAAPPTQASPGLLNNVGPDGEPPTQIYVRVEKAPPATIATPSAVASSGTPSGGANELTPATKLMNTAHRDHIRHLAGRPSAQPQEKKQEPADADLKKVRRAVHDQVLSPERHVPQGPLPPLHPVGERAAVTHRPSSDQHWYYSPQWVLGAAAAGLVGISALGIGLSTCGSSDDPRVHRWDVPTSAPTPRPEPTTDASSEEDKNGIPAKHKAAEQSRNWAIARCNSGLGPRLGTSSCSDYGLAVARIECGPKFAGCRDKHVVGTSKLVIDGQIVACANNKAVCNREIDRRQGKYSPSPSRRPSPRTRYPRRPQRPYDDYSPPVVVGPARRGRSHRNTQYH